MVLITNRAQNVLVLCLFSVIYLALDQTKFFPKYFPESFEPPMSAAQITEGDLYGTCAPIE